MVDHTKLTELIRAIFVEIGSNQNEADCIATHLVAANLVGHDSHGVIRTPIYVRWLKEEKVFLNRRVEVVTDLGALAVLDGQMGFGQSIGKQTLDFAIEKCSEHGVSVTALRNSGHLGRIGHWAEQAIAAGFVSFHFVNTSGLGMHVVPFGGIEKRLSINPITIGVPALGEAPFVFDIAAAMTAEGKLKVARNKGVPVPDGWIIDGKGQPTNDPNDFYDPPGGAILPFGGHKGFGLGVAAELMAGALGGGGCSKEGATRLEQSMLSVLIDPGKLQSRDSVLGEIQRYLDFVRSSRPKTPNSPVMVPGDVERAVRAQRIRDGIELDDNTRAQIADAARGVGLREPLILEALGPTV